MKKVIILFCLIAEISNVLVVGNDRLEFSFSKFQDLPFEELIQISKDVNKPLLLFFTGESCDNVNLMNQMILQNTHLRKKLERDFVFAPLFVDNKTPLSELIINENRKIRTIGERNINLQMSKFNANVQPTFIVLDIKGKEMMRWEYVTAEDFNNNLDVALSKVNN
jgi:thiol:disulfide interchange protein DsbD